MGDTVDLTAQRLRPMPDVVELFESLLKRAKSGEIRAAVVASSCDRASTGTAYATGDGDIAHLVCAIERAKLRLLE